MISDLVGDVFGEVLKGKNTGDAFGRCEIVISQLDLARELNQIQWKMKEHSSGLTKNEYLAEGIFHRFELS